ncbi:MAG: hypothetical protein O3A46_01385 [Candidatus Poribacteria bacterium]|nr:hypothetical protein [Candidatus Poribacteria bacterium]
MTRFDPKAVLEAYLKGAIASAPRFLWLDDSNELAADVRILSVNGKECELLRFHHDLQLRDALEDLKDAPRLEDDFPLSVVVSSDATHDSTAIGDLIHRTMRVAVSPRRLMELMSPNYEWTDAINLLRGNDFWDLAERLIDARLSWEDALTASNTPTLIAECYLQRSLHHKMTGADAVSLWEHIETDEPTRRFLERYPRVSEAAQRAIQRVTPIPVKLERDPDFAVFLWTMYFLWKYAPDARLLNSQFFDEKTWQKYGVHEADELLATCDALLETEPLTVVSQVRMAERSLAADPHRERLFLSLLGLDGERRVEIALRIASTERVSGYLTEQSLRVLIPQIASEPTFISKTRMEQLQRTLERQHLGTKYPSYFPNFADAARLFHALLTLATHVDTFHRRGWEQHLSVQSIETWTSDIFPNHLVPMSLLCDEWLGHRERMSSLLGDAPAELVAEAHRIIVKANYEFARLVGDAYVRWITRHKPPPMFTVDWFDSEFVPHWRELQNESKYPLVVVCMFHGLRWDEWEVVAPVFESALDKHRLESTKPLLAILPSTKPHNTAALILGRFPSLADSGTVGALFAERLAAQGVPFAGSTATPYLKMPDSRAGVVLANIAIAEVGSNKTMRTGTARDEIRQAAEDSLNEFLAQVPPKASVFVLSNGGSTEVTQAATRIKATETQRRWAGFRAMEDGSCPTTDVALFNAEAIRLPNPQVSRCAFAFPDVWFASEPRGAGLRFLSGGISLTEMILPCATFVSRRRRRLDDHEASPNEIGRTAK